MNRDDFYATLAEFFRDAFREDAVGVAEWLAQGGQDVDRFIAELDALHPVVKDSEVKP